MTTPPGGQPPYDPNQPQFDPNTGQPINPPSTPPGPPSMPPSAPGTPPGYDAGYQQPGYPQDQGYPQGYPQGPGYPPQGQPGGGQQQNALAITSLALGILSIPLAFCCFLGFVFGPAAIVTGWLGMKKADESGGRMGGQGMAKAGLICGVVGVLLGVALTVLWLAVGSFDYQWGVNT